MLNITIYMTSTCRHSQRAISLLDSISARYNMIVVDTLEHWDKMEENTGRSTVPQVYVDDCYIGGFDELADLERKGQLRNMLKRA
jgi:glutaredoxin 3